MVGKRVGSLWAEDHDYQAEEVGQDTEGPGEPWEVLEERHDQHALSEAFLGRMDWSRRS